ncbi:NUDIX hydrolase [Yinghuangia seranimata]|uniref:NUDIX hydrolase n=1 Tax=Yinghuangia seranimata TaxID=408067 RepID=UPI00248C85F7|nr:CoA pyrophosphatase [Yinghuangia seranimata]MDI2127902.1 CoA pyrophosphatase [Yinghuangia seranimata]
MTETTTDIAVSAEGLPDWLRPIAEAARTVRAEQLSRFLPPAEGGRESAVLVLFGHGPDGPDVLLLQRATTLRKHAGQPAFPGGAIDPEDAGPVDAALREAREEVGLDPSCVQAFGTLPSLYIPVSDFVVTPVLGWWREACPVAPVDAAEVARVIRVPIADLADPANRARLRHPTGFLGPAFLVEGMVVWGFTAGLLDRTIALSGFERPWDQSREVELSEAEWRLARRGTDGAALPTESAPEPLDP